ncbi:peroxiredoxin [Chitinophaga sp. W3I9]
MVVKQIILSVLNTSIFMKKIFILAAMLAPGWVSAQSGKYTLTIKLPALTTSAKAYLITNYGWSNQQVLDSAMLNKGAFRFSGQVKDPAMVHVLIDHTGKDFAKWKKTADVNDCYLEKGAIQITGTDSVIHAAITGGPVNNDYKRYKHTVLFRREQLGKAVDSMFRTATQQQKKDPHFIDTVMKQYQIVSKETDSLKYVFIRQNPASYICLATLIEVAGKDVDVPRIAPFFKRLSPALRNTGTGKQFAKKLYNLGRLSIGVLAPDFTQNDVNGKPVKLSDFKGKYTLVDFWASWCGPCRAENPNVLKAYLAFKQKNFTIVGVSLDTNKDAWLGAVKKDDLPWQQLSDLKGWKNEAGKLYEVSAIPQNFLLDPQGRIIAKNLRGEALIEKLQELMP